MGTEQPACGLSSLLPDCRGRAEAFARRLQSRLQTLGRPGDANDSNIADENSWLAPRNVTTTQPRLSSSSDSDLYFDFDVEPRSPASPDNDDELQQQTDPLSKSLKKIVRHDPESGCVVSSSSLSPGSEGSDGPYFDTENPDGIERPQNRSSKQIAGTCNGHINLNDTATSTINVINSLNSDVQKDYAINHKLLLNGKPSNESEHNKKIYVPSSTSSIDNNDIPVNETSDERNLENVEIGSYCSTFSRSSDHFIECPVQSNVDEEICNLLPVEYDCTTDEIVTENVSIVTEDILEDTTDCNGIYSTSENSSLNLTNIKQLLKEGYFKDTGQTDDDDDNKILEENVNSSNECEEIENINESHKSSNLLKLDLVNIEQTNNDASETIDENIDLKSDELSIARSNDTDDDDDEAPPQQLRRCTSLKTGKTPPGTPGRKKIVRFADVLGLDLADVRTFLDEVPRIPSSAYNDLRDADLTLGSCAMPVVGSINSQAIPIEPLKCLVPLFQQPGGLPDFMERIKQRQVCLENAVVKDPFMFSIEGTVRVRNLDFHKSVHIRYTLDGWSTFADLQATYVSNSCDGFSDKFSFVLYAHTLVIGQRLEFAVRFQCKGSQFWDSNGGANYTFQCLPPASSTPFLPLSLSSPEDHWATFY